MSSTSKKVLLTTTWRYATWPEAILEVTMAKMVGLFLFAGPDRLKRGYKTLNYIV